MHDFLYQQFNISAYIVKVDSKLLFVDDVIANSSTIQNQN